MAPSFLSFLERIQLLWSQRTLLKLAKFIRSTNKYVQYVQWGLLSEYLV